MISRASVSEEKNLHLAQRAASEIKTFETTLNVIKNDDLNYGFTIRILFFLLNDTILNGECAKSLVKLDVLFSALDNICETVRQSATASNKVVFSSKNEVMSQLQTRNIRLFDFFQVVGGMLFLHIIIYKSRVLLACGHIHEARKALHGGLDVCRVYFGCILQSPGIILFDAPSDEVVSTTSGRTHDARLSSIVKDYLCSFFKLNSSTIDAAVAQSLVVGHITHLLCTGTILCAQIEHALGNFTIAKTLLNEPVAQAGSVSAEVRHNEGCVALELGEIHRAGLFFNQSLDASCVFEREHSVRLEPSKSDLGAGLYSVGLSLLKLSRPAEAFRFFTLAVTTTDRTGLIFGDAPHVWIRLAECCLQREALKEREAAVAQTAATAALTMGGLPFIESISNSRSRRVFLRPPVVVETSAVKTVDEDNDSGCDLVCGVHCLKKALYLTVSAEKPDVDSTGHLINDILLRLSFFHLKLGDPVAALNIGRRLEGRLATVPTSPENYQTKYLNCSYLVQALCVLGKQNEANEVLKTRLDGDCSDEALVNCAIPPGSFLRPSFLAHGAGVARAAQHVNKAIVLLLRGYTSAALTIIEATLRLCADYAPAVRCLLFIYIRQGRHRHALNVLNIYKLSIENL